jgi:L-lactate dehydrogenase (cytochrome)
MVLEHIIDVVKCKYPNVEIYIDGGVRKGTDVIKCLALGADYCFIGRPVFYANACGGEEGISHMLEILKKEIINSMKLMGVTSIEDIK